MHPLAIARFALGMIVVAFVLLLLLGISAPIAAAFAVMFGATNGLMTIARGTVPLALFGAHGYGALIGRIAGPSLVIQAAAPLVVAFAIERWSDVLALTVVAGFAAVAFLAFIAIRRPAAST
jgi:hypothetical protein